MVVASDDVVAVRVRYDDINHYAVMGDTSGQTTRLQQFTVGNHTSLQGIKTFARFTVPKDIKGPAYLYYGVDNFYQNHRSFKESRSVELTVGKLKKTTDLIQCIPFRSPGETTSSSLGRLTVGNRSYGYNEMVYVPCGMAAWSKFNDSFTVYRLGDSPEAGRQLASQLNLTRMNQLGVAASASLRALTANLTLLCNTSDFDVRTGLPLIGGGFAGKNNCTKQNIALDVDREKNFKEMAPLPTIWKATSPYPTSDPYMANGFYQGEPGHKLPEVLDEDFMVWSRVASLSNFKKLFRIIQGDVKAGEYLLEVDEYYPTWAFEGKKYMVITNYSWIGGRNHALGIAYLVAASIASVALIAITLQLLIRGKRIRKTKPLVVRKLDQGYAK
jgi:hypothetical protein